MGYRIRPLAAAITLLVAGAAPAQETVLPAVTVTDTTIPTETTVSRDHVERMRAASSDTAALLADTPGVSLRAAGGVSSFPVIQGVADDRLRIKVDGMDLIASCPNHMNTPLSYLPPSDVGTLKVHGNVAPVSVGGDSIGGGIIAESAAPRFARPDEGALSEGELGGFYRSNGYARGVNASATLATDILSLNYTGSYAKSNDYRAGGDFKDFTATGRPGESLGRNVVGSSAYQTRNQALGVALRADNHLIEARYGYQDIPYEWYPNQRMDMLGNTAHRFNLRYLGAFAWGEFEARAYREKVDHFMDFGADKAYLYSGMFPWNGAGSTANLAYGMPMYTASKTTGAAVKASINLTNRDLLRLGGEFQNYRLDDWWPASGGNMMGPNTFVNINDGKRDRAGVFAEWDANWTQHWFSQAGLRYERVTTNVGPVQGYNAGQYSGASVGTLADFNAMNRRRADDNWDATLLGRYKPDETSSYEFGFARKTRSPNLYERYTWAMNAMTMAMNNFLGDGNGYIGNPDLKPEVAYNVSLTGDWRSADGATRFLATPYYSRVNNYIDAACSIGFHPMYPPTPQLTRCATDRFVPLQYVNQKARIYGLDLFAQIPLAKTEIGGFGLKAMLSYTNGKNRDTGDGLYNTMPLNGKLTLTHEYATWSNALEVVGVRKKTDVSEVRNEIRTAGYGLVNLRASYSWQKLRVDFGVENLFDKRYGLPTGGAYVGQGATMSMSPQHNPAPYGIAVPGMGRSLYAGFNVKF